MLLLLEGPETGVGLIILTSVLQKVSGNTHLRLLPEARDSTGSRK